MSYRLNVKIKKGEYWYGGNVALGMLMPLHRFKCFYVYDTRNLLFNQSSPFLVSSEGRYIYSEEGFRYMVFGTRLLCKSKFAEIKLYEGYENLKGAFLAASKKHFPATGNMPPATKFTKPQYCTWIEFIDDQNQKDIIEYAKTIKAKNMPIGEIILDDGWQNKFGDWTFKKETFPEPKKMIDELKSMGFDVSLWICPFVQFDAPDFEYLEENNLLIRDKKGKIANRRWWNGRDPVLDFTHPKAREWFSEKCQWLIDEYGVSGFKQDAGDPLWYRNSDQLYAGVTANEHSLYWAKSALDFEYNELRACWKGGGLGIAQRLADKRHSWSKYFGLRSLIPNMLALGIIGHPYGCPDMVGGGLETSFKPNSKFDNELFIRSAQCCAPMPMMQYSKSIWNLKNKEDAQLCIDAANYHQRFVDYIIEVAKESAHTCEPIVRYMEYSYPKSGYGKVTQQFMLGDKYLVAPMVWKKKSRKIHFPAGSRWQDIETKEIIEGGQVLKVEVPIEKLPVYEKID